MEIKENFADYLVRRQPESENIVKKKLYVAGVSKVLIESVTPTTKLRVIVLTAKPGMVIGRSGDGIEALKKRSCKTYRKSK